MDMVGMVAGVGRQGTVLRRTERESRLLMVKIGQHWKAHQP